MSATVRCSKWPRRTPPQGIVFYTLEQKASRRAQFQRVTACLGCHLNADTLGVPGLLMFSTTPASDTRPTRSTAMDHRMPLKDRWGGGSSPEAAAGPSTSATGCPRSTAARARELASASGLFDPDGFRATTSDIAALMVFSHQTLHDQPDHARRMGSARRGSERCTRRLWPRPERTRGSPPS